MANMDIHLNTLLNYPSTKNKHFISFCPHTYVHNYFQQDQAVPAVLRVTVASSVRRAF